MRKEFKLADYEETIDQLDEEYDLFFDWDNVDIHDGSLYNIYRFLVTVPQLGIKLREGDICDADDEDSIDGGFFVYGEDTSYANFEEVYYGHANGYIYAIGEEEGLSEEELDEVTCVVEW